MPHRLRYEYNALSSTYPDDESDKQLCFQASGTLAADSRTVFLYWVNTVFPDDEEVWQVVRLRHDRDDDVFEYVYPDLIVVDGFEREYNATYRLGILSRDQRETVLECAEDVVYETRPRPSVEDQASRWMSELLERMVAEGLVERGAVDAIREAVPLVPLGQS